MGHDISTAFVVGDMEEEMKTFVLNRITDETGISGTGIIAEGAEFTNGKCVLSWLTEFTSVAVYDSLETLMHIHGHDGNTELIWQEK